MPDNYYSELNENGVVTPLRDLAAFPRSEQAVLGAKNLLQNTGVSGTSSGVSFVVNTNKSVTCSNTASGGNGQFTVNADLSYLPKNTPLILSGFPSTGTANKRMFVRWEDGGNTVYKVDQGEGVTFSIPSTATNIVCLIVYSDGQTANETVYPMIRIASDTDPTYAPYAMTNEELTELTYKKQGSALIGTYTFAENISSDAAAVARAGYIIMHTLRLIVSADIEANTVVITDGLGYVTPNMDMTFNTVFRTSAGDEYKMSIVTASGGKVQLKTLTAIPNGKQLRGSIIFISQ